LKGREAETAGAKLDKIEATGPPPLKKTGRC